MRKLVVVCCLLLGGCATSFMGAAKVTNGRAGCEQKCRDAGMAFAGMVFMGEYSDACVCQAASGQTLNLSEAGAGGAAGAAVAVVVQTAAQQQQNQHHH